MTTSCQKSTHSSRANNNNYFNRDKAYSSQQGLKQSHQKEEKLRRILSFVLFHAIQSFFLSQHSWQETICEVPWSKSNTQKKSSKKNILSGTSFSESPFYKFFCIQVGYCHFVIIVVNQGFSLRIFYILNTTHVSFKHSQILASRNGFLLSRFHSWKSDVHFMGQDVRCLTGILHEQENDPNQKGDCDQSFQHSWLFSNNRPLHINIWLDSPLFVSWLR